MGIVVGVLGLAFLILGRVPATVRVEHTFDAPAQKVWATWNHEESIKKWWSPKHYTAEIGIPALIYFFAKLGWEQQFDKFETLLH